MQVAMCTLDSELQEKYFQQLAGGAPLLMHLQGWSHQQVFLAAASTGDFNVSFSKPLSRLGSIFVTMAPALGQPEIRAGIQYANTFAAYRQNRENFECYMKSGASGCLMRQSKAMYKPTTGSCRRWGYTAPTLRTSA